MIRLRWPYWVAIVICLVLVWHVSRSDQAENIVVAMPVRPSSPQAVLQNIPVSAGISGQASAPSTFLPLEIRPAVIASAASSVAASAVFAIRDWAPPPPPPPKPAPPPPPKAPPLPFRYMGQMQEDGGKVQVYLVNGDALHTAKVGDTLDGTYKVQKIDRQQITVLYLPLNQIQTLHIGGE